jgi:hypothetical protein
VLAKADLLGREDVGVLRLRLAASEDRPAVLLDLDYWVLVPK